MELNYLSSTRLFFLLKFDTVLSIDFRYLQCLLYLLKEKHLLNCPHTPNKTSDYEAKLLDQTFCFILL